MSQPIRVLLVDDERLAREGARELLTAERDVEIVGECGDGQSAVDAINTGNVDLVLLDVQMPGMDGFDVVRAVPESSLPVVVFVTAYSQHALRAFDAHALDYIVKPFADERFRRAVARARAQVRQRRLGHASAELASLVAGLGPFDAQVEAPVARARYLARIPIRSVGRVTYVRVPDVVWVAAADYYAELHTRDGRKHLVRETLQNLEERLDPASFVRVHRSAIASIDNISEIRTDGAERQFVVLRDGTKLPLGKARRDAVVRVLGHR